MKESKWNLQLTQIGPGIEKSSHQTGSRFIEVKVTHGENDFIQDWEANKRLDGQVFLNDTFLTNIALTDVARTTFPLPSSVYRFRTSELVPLEYEEWLDHPGLSIIPKD